MSGRRGSSRSGCDASESGRGTGTTARLRPVGPWRRWTAVHVVNVDQAHRKLPLILEHADVLIMNGVCSVDLLPVIQQRKLRGG